MAFLVAFIFAAPLGKSVRMSAFRRLTERSKPLIGAIHAFEQKYGHPPESLQALLPEFMPSVPATGMGAYPDYRYSATDNEYQGNPWTIRVYTPEGMDFDQFMYFPLTNYPETGFGGWLERVGDWAYVHE